MSSSPPAKPILSSDLLGELLAIVAEISAVLEPDELLPTIAKELRRIVNYRILDIFLPEPDGTLRPVFVEGYSQEMAARPRRARSWWFRSFTRTSWSACSTWSRPSSIASRRSTSRS